MNRTYFSSWVMMTSWNGELMLRCSMIPRMASARDALFAASKFVVGSSSAKTPHLEQNASESARRIRMQARTYVHRGLILIRYC